MAGEEEGETLHGSPQRAEDVQDFHEAAAAVTQVNTARLFLHFLVLRFVFSEVRLEVM